MTSPVLRLVLRRSLNQVRHVTPVRPGAGAPGLVTAVYAQVERDFGMLAPPVALHSPAPGTLAASWLMLRDTLVRPGRAGRAAGEVVAASVSLANTCPYCVTVHGAALRDLSGEEAVGAVTEGRPESITDPGLRALAQWARSPGPAPVPFPPEHAPELLGVVLTFHYLNRMVNVFLEESPLPPALPPAARGTVLAVLGRVMRYPGAPGPRTHDEDLLPAAPLPGDLAWAAGDRRVADTLARAAAAIEAAGARALPEPVRERVRATVASWDGRPPPLGRAWLDEPVAGLDPADRPAARLALLTALASHQVTRADVEAFPHDDESLIELTSWSALTAARALTRRIAGDAAGTVPR